MHQYEQCLRHRLLGPVRHGQHRPVRRELDDAAFDGPKAIRAVAVDAATNTGQHIRTITVDRTAPSGVTVTYPNG